MTITLEKTPVFSVYLTEKIVANLCSAAEELCKLLHGKKEEQFLTLEPLAKLRSALELLGIKFDPESPHLYYKKEGRYVFTGNTDVLERIATIQERQDRVSSVPPTSKALPTQAITLLPAIEGSENDGCSPMEIITLNKESVSHLYREVQKRYEKGGITNSAYAGFKEQYDYVNSYKSSAPKYLQYGLGLALQLLGIRYSHIGFTDSNGGNMIIASPEEMQKIQDIIYSTSIEHLSIKAPSSSSSLFNASVSGAGLFSPPPSPPAVAAAAGSSSSSSIISSPISHKGSLGR